MPASTIRASVPRHPECSSAIAPEGCARNTGTQSAMVTATAVAAPASHAWPSAAGARSHPRQSVPCAMTRAPWTW